MYLGIDSTSVWNSIGGMRHHSSTRNSIIWCFVDGGKSCLRHLSRISHKCSIRLRSGHWDSKGIWFTCSTNNWVTTRTLCMGALSSYGSIAMVAKIMACPAFFIHDPKHDGMLINSGTTPVWKNLLSIYFVIPPLLRRFLYLISYLYVKPFYK